MKKSALLYHCCAPLALTICLLFGLPRHIHAQGFFTQTNQTNIGLNDARFEFLPDGYVVKVSYSNAVVEDFCTGYLGLDAAGQETGWSPGECYGLEIGATQMIWLPDDDVLSVRASLVDTLMHIVKMQPDGDTVWHSTVPKNQVWQYEPMAIKQNDAGEIFILGRAYDHPQQIGLNELFLLKISPNGSLIWQINEQTLFNLPLAGASLAVMPDGGCVYSLYIGNATIQYISLHRVTGVGDHAWSRPLDYFYDNLLADDTGNIYSLSPKIDSIESYSSLIKWDPQGQLLWEHNLNTIFQIPFSYPTLLVKAADGDLMAIGHQWDTGQLYDIFFARFAPNGASLWKKNYSFLRSDVGVSFGGAEATPDNGFIIAGMLHDSLFVLKMGPNGEVYPGTVSGQLAIDANVNCLNDTLEQPLTNWLVRLAGGITLFATTDSTGAYLMEDVPGGDYQLSALPPSHLWEPCPETIQAAIPDSGVTVVNQDFSMQAAADCPSMTLDLSTPLLRRCFENVYTVRYCNDGTVAADSAYVDILLDPALDFNGASIPFQQNGDHLHFPLGMVAALECGSFQFTVTPNCDSTEIGETLCVSAAIFPDTICNPPLDWSGATLVGSAVCETDSVRFTLRNIGTAPSTPTLDFIVVDDHVIMMRAPIPSLNPDDIYTTAVPADGSVWHFIAEQEPNHPGNEPVSVGVESCGGLPFPGFMLGFLNTDGNPFTVRNCQELIGSWDPNDKTATPRGVDDEHFIEPGTPLTYRIRFQNTGTDTAFTVVVRDTLAPWLDPATLRVGAASHAYTFDLSGTGILTFAFANIALPDSNINEPASHGFVQFAIEQRAGIPLGTVLENRAGIYFDFNSVVLTNTAWHTVDTGFLKVYVGTDEPKKKETGLDVFPNPAGEMVWATWLGENFAAGQLVLFDIFGKKVLQKNTSSPMVEIRRDTLPAGVYWLEWTSEKGPKRRGKIVFR